MWKLVLLGLLFFFNLQLEFLSCKPLRRLNEIVLLSFLNPLTAGAAYIRFLHFLLACTISAFKHNEDKM